MFIFQELNAEYLQDQILNQISIIFEGEVVPFWIRNQGHVKLKIGNRMNDLLFVVSIESKEKTDCYRLIPNTEIIVAPKSRGNNKHKPIALQFGQPKVLRISPDSDEFPSLHPQFNFPKEEKSLISDLHNIVAMNSLQMTHLEWSRGQLAMIQNSNDPQTGIFVRIFDSPAVSGNHLAVPGYLRDSKLLTIFSRVKYFHLFYIDSHGLEWFQL
jgi:hypothetical protein